MNPSHSDVSWDNIITTRLAFSFSPLMYSSIVVSASPWIRPLQSNEKVSDDIDSHWRTRADTLL